MRIALMIAGVAFAWFASVCPVQAEEWTKQWSVGAHPELRVTAGDASLSVQAGSSNQISAIVRTRGISIGGSGLRITENQSGDRVELEIREPSHHFSWGMRSIEVEIHVPRDLTADLHTGDGSIRATGVHGNLHISTGDGSVQGDDLDGALDARTGDGSMHIRGRFDDLKVRTGDGSVEVQADPGSRMQTDWHVESGDGSVRLTVPHDLAANVHLRTGDGSIHMDLPLTIQGSQKEHEIEGKLNGGGPYLEVHTGDGPISVGAR